MTGPDASARPEEQTGMRLRFDLAYVGTHFHGWQEQPNHRTVQGELKNAISYLLGRPATPIGAGRTDTGVHARGQIAHLTVNGPEEFERLQRALQRRLPEDISVENIRHVSPDFHAIQSATSRLYHYYLSFRRDIFRPHEWQVHWRLDRAAMDEAVICLKGDHDFSSFCKSASLKDDGNVCRLDLCAFEWNTDSAIFQVRGNRFLHHMVRIMVGTLVEVGRGERCAAEVPRILAARDRCEAGCMAPACGLFMQEIEYPESLLDPGYRDPERPDRGSPDLSD